LLAQSLPLLSQNHNRFISVFPILPLFTISSCAVSCGGVGKSLSLSYMHSHIDISIYIRSLSSLWEFNKTSFFFFHFLLLFFNDLQPWRASVGATVSRIHSSLSSLFLLLFTRFLLPLLLFRLFFQHFRLFLLDYLINLGFDC